MNKSMILISVLVAAIAAVAGCGKRNGSIGDFRPEHEPRAVHHFVNAQTANGARADATLQPHHFDGERLNSLGLEKLLLMIEPAESGQLIVYLNLPHDNEQTDARRGAVADFLKQRGLTDEHASIEIGRNPATFSPAAKQLEGLHRARAREAAAAESTGMGATTGAQATD